MTRHSASGYLPDAGLVDAVNVALLLGQPLLVAGEPGTGKTQLAAAVAYQLGLEAPLVFETKSTATARDLFYSFDHVGRFRNAQTGAPIDVRHFLTYNALGEAILRTQSPATIRHLVPDSFERRHRAVRSSFSMRSTRRPETSRMTFSMRSTGCSSEFQNWAARPSAWSTIGIGRY
jgi:ATPase family associated with various cellular activities (AAA)